MKNLQERAGPEKVQTEEEKTQAQEMAQLRAEVNSLWEEYKGQLDLRGKQQESEAGFKQQIDGLFERRDALRKERVSHALSFLSSVIKRSMQEHAASRVSANSPLSHQFCDFQEILPRSLH